MLGKTEEKLVRGKKVHSLVQFVSIFQLVLATILWLFKFLETLGKAE